jgi:hypothetical protein
MFGTLVDLALQVLLFLVYELRKFRGVVTADKCGGKLFLHLWIRLLVNSEITSLRTLATSLCTDLLEGEI